MLRSIRILPVASRSRRVGGDTSVYARKDVHLTGKEAATVVDQIMRLDESMPALLEAGSAHDARH